MHSRPVIKLLLLAAATAVFASVFATRWSAGHAGAGRPLVSLERRAEAGEPRAASGEPRFFTRFDVALLVLGSLGLTGFCLQVPAFVAATPFGLPRLRAGVATRVWAGARYAPLLVMGIVLLTATTAAAQADPPAPPYVGAPLSDAAPPDVGPVPPEMATRLPAGVYVDAVPSAVPPVERSPDALAVVGPALGRTLGAATPAVVGAPTESPADDVARTGPVTAADLAGLAVLVGAAVLVVVAPRWRCR